MTDDVIEADDPGELPSRDPRRVGRKQRYGYFVQNRDNPEIVDFGGLIKRDYRNGSVEVWDPGPSATRASGSSCPRAHRRTRTPATC